VNKNMVKRKKAKKLVVSIYPSGVVGKGKKRVKVVSSTLTPRQYEDRFYGSSLHFRTEAAISAKYLK
jgi:hypothetical protein